MYVIPNETLKLSCKVHAFVPNNIIVWDKWKDCKIQIEPKIY